MHFLETMRFAPDGKNGYWRDRYWEEHTATLVPRLGAIGMTLVGAWQTPIGAGNGNEFSVLWSVPDGEAWTAYQRLYAGTTTDPTMRQWRELHGAYAESNFGRLLLASPGHDLTLLGRHAEGHEVSVAGNDRPWLYEVEFTQFQPEGRDGRFREDYWPEFRERLFPTLGRLGLDLVGAWETAPGSGWADECVFLYRTRDFASWQAFIDSSIGTTKDPVLRARRSEMWVWREQWYSKLMVPSPGHGASALHNELE
jgi:hypothetical protein